MKNLLSLLAIFALSITALAQTGAKTAAKTAHSGDLVALLPASDMVTTINLKRFLNEVLPQVLAGKPEELQKINDGIAKFKDESGIDLRSFEEAAIGVDLSNISLRNLPDAEDGVVLLRGTFNPTALVALGKLASKNKFRVEKIGDRTVTIFPVGEIVKDAAKGKPATAPKGGIERFFDNLLKGDIAITAIDGATLAFGKPQSMRSLLTDPNNRAASNLQINFQRKSGAIVNFAADIPAKDLPQTGEAMIDETISAIQVVSGSIDMRGGDALVQLSAQTTKPNELDELFQLGQSFGSNFIKNRLLRNFVKNLTISKTGGEVNLEGVLPASDLNKLIEEHTKKPAEAIK